MICKHGACRQEALHAGRHAASIVDVHCGSVRGQYLGCHGKEHLFRVGTDIKFAYMMEVAAGRATSRKWRSNIIVDSGTFTGKTMGEYLAQHGNGQ